MPDGMRAEPVVYVDRSDVRDGWWDELKVGVAQLAAFVERHQPQMASYCVYLDEDTRRMAVVSVHPDSASLERHIEIGTPEFKKLAPFIDLREIEVFGQLSDSAAELVRQKAAALGEHGAVTLHRTFAGFSRLS